MSTEVYKNKHETNQSSRCLFLGWKFSFSTLCSILYIGKTSIARSWCNVFIKYIVFFCHPIYCITCDWLYFYEYITSCACYVVSPFVYYTLLRCQKLLKIQWQILTFKIIKTDLNFVFVTAVFRLGMTAIRISKWCWFISNWLY
jgi:hypothetical protein